MGVHLARNVLFLESQRALKLQRFLACSTVIGRAGEGKLQAVFHACVLIVHAVDAFQHPCKCSWHPERVHSNQELVHVLHAEQREMVSSVAITWGLATEALARLCLVQSLLQALCFPLAGEHSPPYPKYWQGITQASLLLPSAGCNYASQ